MPEHKIGTREEWQAARDELAKLEAEQAERNEEVKRKRLELPWVPVEKEYEFDTEDGKKTLAELFDGRSQLLAYNVMFGPDYTLGACPGCTSLADGLDGSLVHLNHRDVTLLCFSRAPIERLTAYKRRMGWEFPYVSTYNTDFAFDFGLALTEEQAQQIPEVKEMVDNPPDWLEEWSGQIGAELKDGLRENPSWIAFARENGDRLPHLHGVGARPVRRAVLQLPARANAESPDPPSPAPGGRTSTRTDADRDRFAAHSRALRAMAKLIYMSIASLDGYVEDAQGKFDWAEPDEEVHAFVNDLARPVGTYLYGRRMYETMVFWERPPDLGDQPPFVQDFAEIWQGADKIAYSKTLDDGASARTRIEREFDPEAVRQLKATAARDLAVGGALRPRRSGPVWSTSTSCSSRPFSWRRQALPPRQECPLESRAAARTLFPQRHGVPALPHPRGHGIGRHFPVGQPTEDGVIVLHDVVVESGVASRRQAPAALTREGGGIAGPPPSHTCACAGETRVAAVSVATSSRVSPCRA